MKNNDFNNTADFGDPKDTRNLKVQNNKIVYLESEDKYIPTRDQRDVIDIIFEEDDTSKKENMSDNVSPEPTPIYEQVIDYFTNCENDLERKINKDENKASCLSLHPSRLPKSTTSVYSPVTSAISKGKSKTAYQGMNDSQKRVNPFKATSYPKNLTPVNLNQCLSKCDDFTYKTPGDTEFNEFKEGDIIDANEGTLYDYISGCNSPDSLCMQERLRKYDTQFERT